MLRQIKFIGVPEREPKTGQVKKNGRLVAAMVHVPGEAKAREIKVGDVLELSEGQAGTLLGHALYGCGFELGEKVEAKIEVQAVEAPPTPTAPKNPPSKKHK